MGDSLFDNVTAGLSDIFGINYEVVAKCVQELKALEPVGQSLLTDLRKIAEDDPSIWKGKDAVEYNNMSTVIETAVKVVNSNTLILSAFNTFAGTKNMESENARTKTFRDVLNIWN